MIIQGPELLFFYLKDKDELCRTAVMAKSCITVKTHSESSTLSRRPCRGKRKEDYFTSPTDSGNMSVKFTLHSITTLKTKKNKHFNNTILNQDACADFLQYTGSMFALTVS